MQTTDIIAGLDAEISLLQQVKALLNATVKLGPDRPAVRAASPKKRVLSPEARARIVAAQKARWAKFRKAAK
jgi:hypothetical protein